MKKIMFVIGVLSNGGAERVISVIAKEFIDMGYEVDIITIYGEKNDYIKDKRIHIHPLNQKTKKGILRTLAIIHQIRSLIKTRKPDIIVSFVAIVNIYTIIASAFMKTKLVVSERNDPYQNPENKYIRKLRNILYRFSDGFVFQTYDAMKYFPPRIQRKGIIIANPIKSNLPHWDKDNSEKVIITACRLVKQKNLSMLIKSFAKIKNEFPEYKLKIYGIGVLREELLNLVNELGLNNDVLLPGFSKDVHNEMAKSDLFVISSNYEGISNSMLEALAIGVPVVSTDSPIGGARMFIKDGENGILTEVGNTNELYQAMKKVLSDKKFACHLSEEAKKVRTELSSEVIVKQWLEYIYEICEVNNAKSIQ